MKKTRALPIFLLLPATVLPALAHADPIYVYGMATATGSETCYVSDSVIIRPELPPQSQEYIDQLEKERERWRRAIDRQDINNITSTNSRRIVDRSRRGRDDAEDDRRELIRSLKNSCTVVIVPW